ncbi:serine hydrolase [Streptomyces albulus]|nr:serine hydrolase [Streptomyces noursei]
MDRPARRGPPRVGRLTRVEAPPRPASAGLRARPKRSVADAHADPTSLTSRAFAAISPAPTRTPTPTALPNSPPPPASPPPLRWPAPTPHSSAPSTTTPALRPGHPHPRPHRGVRRPRPHLLVTTRFGLGFMLHGPSSPLLGTGSFGHPGRGGALAFADPERGIAFGYVTNGMQPNVTADPRAQALVRALAAVGG